MVISDPRNRGNVFGPLSDWNLHSETHAASAASGSDSVAATGAFQPHNHWYSDSTTAFLRWEVCPGIAGLRLAQEPLERLTSIAAPPWFLRVTTQPLAQRFGPWPPC